MRYTVFADDLPLLSFDEDELRAILAAGEYKVDAILNDRVAEYVGMTSGDNA